MNRQAENLGYSGTGEPEDVLRWALAEFYPDIAFAASFEHTVLIDMMTRIRPDIRVFSLDTGRLPEETFQCAAEAERHFKIHVDWYFPDRAAVELLTREQGVYSFRESLEARRHCCRIRKVEPLGRALQGLRAWITGLRQDEAESRRELRQIELDEGRGGLVKINPLAYWTDRQVRDYTHQRRLPYNRLFDCGYASIGCACCTRPIAPGEDPRAGRWWWESPEHKECGLHVNNRLNLRSDQTP
ncbi:MAG TPA: phosphoadenylyl-sulfate reductase [Verrucomicrobia bacterium]|nr:MAG: phosphoadenosine phosphosulfate reductase [Lentisphaerae bacterium GWF2_57_35]HBA83796.1 phosphoadenylyl-sulfate reductase [Verrucomicrobiota bacterium]